MNTGFDQFHPRRRSFSGGFPAGGFAPPAHSDGGFRRDGGFNDPYNSNYQEPFQSGGGSYPSSVGMPASYPMGAPYSNSYDSSPLSDNQFVSLDDNYGTRQRTLSAGGGGGFGPPALLPSAPPMTPYPSHYSGKRMRRASSVGPGWDTRALHVAIKFRLKGSTHSGISLSEALERVRLSTGNAYLMHDIASDMYGGKIQLRVRWSGYRSNTYSIPMSADYHGYIDLQSLARRTSRAIAHFMQLNGIALAWNRVVIHRLEESNPGTWIPVLTTH
ncbi:hypothetical protein BJV77DRAFT_1007459 [Russula vinacea]|nr:hypothetical protein BJV77DRAFT_1007459 [Russula vinacea]